MQQPMGPSALRGEDPPGDDAQQMNQLAEGRVGRQSNTAGPDQCRRYVVVRAGGGGSITGYLAQTRRPSAVQRSRDRDVCGAKQVAPSASPMGSDPGDAFALGRRAALCRPSRAKIDARWRLGQGRGTVWSPDLWVFNSSPGETIFRGRATPEISRSEAAPALSGSAYLVRRRRCWPRPICLARADRAFA
jgi:hypothetical protein